MDVFGWHSAEWLGDHIEWHQHALWAIFPGAPSKLGQAFLFRRLNPRALLLMPGVVLSWDLFNMMWLKLHSIFARNSNTYINIYIYIYIVVFFEKLRVLRATTRTSHLYGGSPFLKPTFVKAAGIIHSKQGPVGPKRFDRLTQHLGDGSTYLASFSQQFACGLFWETLFGLFFIRAESSQCRWNI